MDRRKSLKVASGGLAAILATGQAPAIAQARKLWRLQHTWPKTSPGLATGGNAAAEFITKATGGSLTVQTFSGGEIVPPFGTLEAVANGTIQMGYGYITYWAGQAPAVNFLGTLPFGLTVQEQDAWYAHGGGQALAEKVYGKLGVKFLYGGNTPVQPAGWFNKEIKSIDDFKGLKMRVGGLGATVLRAMGVTPISMPLAEVPQALQTGAIDAVDFVGPLNDLAFGLHKAAKFYYWPGWMEPSGPYDLMINPKAWDTLSATEKEIVRASSAVATTACNNDFWAKSPVAFNALVNEHKVQIRTIPDATLRQMSEIAYRVINEEANKNVDSKEIWNSVMNFRRTVMPYMSYSELAFMQIRSQVKFG